MRVRMRTPMQRLCITAAGSVPTCFSSRLRGCSCAIERTICTGCVQTACRVGSSCAAAVTAALVAKQTLSCVNFSQIRFGHRVQEERTRRHKALRYTSTSSKQSDDAVLTQMNATLQSRMMKERERERDERGEETCDRTAIVLFFFFAKISR